MKLKKKIEEGQLKGIFRAYALLDKEGTPLWPGKYATQADVDEEREKIGNEYAWQREYLLKILSDEDQVIDLSWIQYYDELPKDPNKYRIVYMGVDLAISQKETADYTAIVSGLLKGYEKDFCLYILPNMVNRRMKFPETIQQIKDLYHSNKQMRTTRLLVENVGYQQAVIDQLMNDGIKAEGVKVTSDKRSRLMTVSTLIQSGKIKFPKKGAEALVRQIVGFGSEAHDDLVDAFTIIAHQAIEMDKRRPHIYSIYPDRTRDDPFGGSWDAFHIGPNTRF